MEKKDRILRLLALGSILILTSLFIFKHLNLSIDYDRIFGRDWALHLINNFKVFHCHFNFYKILAWYMNSASNIVHYPPFNYLISAVLMEFLKLPPLGAVYASKAVWIIVGSLALYSAGRILGNSLCAGIFAAVIGVLNALMFEMAMDVSLEFIVPQAFALVVYCYLLSRAYQRLAGSIALGVVLAIGLLSKTALFMFAAPFLVFGFFFTPFEIESRLLKRFLYAALAAAIAFAIASVYYLPLLSQLLSEAHTESGLSFIGRNLSNIFSYSFPFIITPFALLVTTIAVILQVKKADPFLIPTFATLLISSAYMATLQTLGSTYLLTFVTIFALITARSFKYIKSFLRIALTALIMLLFYIPTLTGRTYTESRLVNRFFYPYDKWETRTIIVPRGGRDCDWELVENFAILFKNRYAQYDYEDIGYFLAGGMIHLTNVALALVKEDDAWLKDTKYGVDVIDVSLDKNVFKKKHIDMIKARKLVVVSLPNETSGDSYEFLHRKFDELKTERNIDFSFPMHWDLFLPGDFKILMLTKKQAQ